MPTRQQQLILDMTLHRISEDELLGEVGIARVDATGFALKALEEAYRQTSAVDVECALYLGFRFGTTPEFLDVLIRLSDADWHHRHEDVVTALDQLRDPKAVEALYGAALKIHPYLEYDDCRALAGKAIWALGNLGDKIADEKLRLLAESDSLVVRDSARKQLYRRSKPVNPEQRKQSNSLCERVDKEKDPTIRAQLLNELRELYKQREAAEQEWLAEQGWGTSPQSKRETA
jgi:hypothetical protein